MLGFRGLGLQGSRISDFELMWMWFRVLGLGCAECEELFILTTRMTSRVYLAILAGAFLALLHHAASLYTNPKNDI